jgi:bifunctional non-homologous end joining protein LigD
MLWRSSAPVRHPPGFIAPCLPTNAHAVPAGPHWVYEIKHDGFRFVCRRDGDRVRVFSRRGIDHSDRAPVIAGPDGVTDFDRLRAAMGRKGSRQAFLYAFDLLELDGQDLRREPWETRRATLASLLRKVSDGIRLCEHIEDTDGSTIFGHACRMGLEGIVAKRRDRPYRSGRSPDWIKVKNPDAPAATRVIEY